MAKKKKSTRKPKRKGALPEDILMGQMLMEIREAAGLSQRALAAQLSELTDRSVPQNQIANIELSGRKMSHGEIMRWCQACEVDVKTYLMMYERQLSKIVQSKE